jgi:hypothetical protein
VRLRERLRSLAGQDRKTGDPSSHFDPAPSPDELVRLVAGARGAQVLRFALQCMLFDYLEQTRNPAELAAELNLNAGALVEMLDALAALGLVEHCREGYRNLELASRYLRSTSPESLAATLVFQTGQASDLELLACFAKEGPQRDPSPADGNDQGYRRSQETLSRFAAPFVAAKLDLVDRGPVMVLSYDGEAYREAFSGRWPHLTYQICNPFLRPEGLREFLTRSRDREGAPGAIVLSGILGVCDDAQVEALVGWTSSHLRPHGLLAVHDVFMPPCVAPPPEIVLGALFRRAAMGGSTIWSVARLQASLQMAGLQSLQVDSISGGTTLITAIRPAR